MPKILAVDDNLDILQIYLDALISEYDVASAVNGEAAIALALKETPDLILMDMEMPVIDGILATRILKEDQRTSTIPIIIVTGLDSEEDAIIALDAGADDYVSKPFNLRLLDARIRAHLRTKSLYDSLEKANKKLSELDRLKSGFIAMAVHELKSPLNVVNGCLHILKEGPTTPEQTSPLMLAINCNTDLINLVNDLLDISIIESGPSLELKTWNIEEVIGSVLNLMNKDANKNGLRIIFSGTDLEAVFDRKRIMQVLTNLLSNAIKFTPPPGKITITVGEDDGMVTVTVSDTGRGIPKEAMDKVFDEFYRHDKKEEGTGLGLAVCKRIVQLHGGTIWVESEIERGSAFHFTLPKPLKS